MTIRKSGNGITYWSAENAWYSADKKLFQQGKLALNITRDYYLLQKRQDKPTDPITYDLVPLKGPVHVGDIVAVRLALSGTDWKYLLAEDPIPAGTEFLAETGLYKLNNKPDWWADWFTRKEFHDDRAAFFNTDFSGRREYVYLLKVVNPGKFAISPASGRAHVSTEYADHYRSRHAGGAAMMRRIFLRFRSMIADWLGRVSARVVVDRSPDRWGGVADRARPRVDAHSREACVAGAAHASGSGSYRGGIRGSAGGHVSRIFRARWRPREAKARCGFRWRGARARWCYGS